MQKEKRLVFIDIIRAFAIVMMLQGHFIDGLLANEARDMNNGFFLTWLYFRGITAPLFFSITGFIFTYLLLKKSNWQERGWKNPRVKKGIKRGVLLIGIGYVLRFNVQNFFFLNNDPNAILVDVLHCIGTSLIIITLLYTIVSQCKHYKVIFGSLLLVLGFALFLAEPLYKSILLESYPKLLANYFTQAYGSVFTLFPWFGYVALGGTLATAFQRWEHQKNFYTYLILFCLLVGNIFIFIWGKSWCNLYYQTQNDYFLQLSKGALFLRLGNVLVLFAFFALLRKLIKNDFIQRIGQNTLSIYIIHYFILYGSLSGHGLYRYFHHSLNWWQATLGAALFVGVVLLIWQSFIGRFLNKLLQ